MAPKRVATLGDTIRKVLTNGLVTQFGVSSNVAKKFLPEIIEQWGKLHRLEGRDIMHMCGIISKRMDGRDASFICVHELIVKYSWKIISFHLLPNSMSNSLIKTSDIKMFPQNSS